MIAGIVVATGEVKVESDLQVLRCGIAEVDAVSSITQTGVTPPRDAIGCFIKVAGAVGVVEQQRQLQGSAVILNRLGSGRRRRLWFR